MKIDEFEKRLKWAPEELKELFEQTTLVIYATTINPAHLSAETLLSLLQYLLILIRVNEKTKAQEILAELEEPKIFTKIKHCRNLEKLYDRVKLLLLIYKRKPKKAYELLPTLEQKREKLEGRLESGNCTIRTKLRLIEILIAIAHKNEEKDLVERSIAFYNALKLLKECETEEAQREINLYASRREKYKQLRDALSPLKSPELISPFETPEAFFSIPSIYLEIPIDDTTYYLMWKTNQKLPRPTGDIQQYIYNKSSPIRTTIEFGVGRFGFASNFNIDDVIGRLVSNNFYNSKIYNGINGCTQMRYFRYDGCGTVDGKQCNYFCVETLLHKGGKEIVKIYPIAGEAKHLKKAPNVGIKYKYIPDRTISDEELEDLKKCIDTDPYRVINTLENRTAGSLSSLAKVYYAQSLIRVGRVGETKEILDSLNSEMIDDEMVKTYLRAANSAYHIIAGEYDKALDLARDNCNGVVLSPTLYWLQQKTGQKPSATFEPDDYLMKQIENYSPERFTKFVKDNRINKVGNEQETNDIEEFGQARFNSDFPLSIVIKTVENNLSDENEMNLIDGYAVEYFFKYPNCAKINGQVCDYFRVVVLRGTKNIIDIHPTIYGKEFPCVVLRRLANQLSKVYSENHKGTPSS